MGKLYIVATPIGNREDITIRALKTLFSVDFILCEDTRKTGSLLEYYRNTQPYSSMIQTVEPKKARFISYYNEVENIKLPQIIKLLQEGNNIALVSDSGTPLISDPGFRLINECVKRGIRIIPIPGASALTTSLSIAGLNTNHLFLGFLPKSHAKRINQLNLMLLCFKTLEHKPSLVFYEAPHRLLETLQDIKEVFGDPSLVVCRELTKIHEEVWRGKVSEALDHFKNPKGEFVILINMV